MRSDNPPKVSDGDVGSGAELRSQGDGRVLFPELEQGDQAWSGRAFPDPDKIP